MVIPVTLAHSARISPTVASVAAMSTRPSRTVTRTSAPAGTAAESASMTATQRIRLRYMDASLPVRTGDPTLGPNACDHQDGGSRKNPSDSPGGAGEESEA